jgi:hypothetical protein
MIETEPESLKEMQETVVFQSTQQEHNQLELPFENGRWTMK